MRGYSKKSPSFWHWANQNNLTPIERLIADYLLSGPDANMLGLYVLSPHAMAEAIGAYSKDGVLPFQGGFDNVLRALRRVCATGFATWDEATGWIWVHKAAGWQILSDWEPLRPNSRRAKEAQKAFHELPENPFKEALFHKYRNLLCLDAPSVRAETATKGNG